MKYMYYTQYDTDLFNNATLLVDHYIYFTENFGVSRLSFAAVSIVQIYLLSSLCTSKVFLSKCTSTQEVGLP